MYDGKNHAFYATRKGLPKGDRGPWALICDDCGRGLFDPIHVVSKEEDDETILKAFEKCLETFFETHFGEGGEQ